MVSASDIKKLREKTGAGIADGLLTVIAPLKNTPADRAGVKAGDKIAQILIQKIEQPKIVITNKLSKSERGEGRYGSTGKQ